MSTKPPEKTRMIVRHKYLGTVAVVEMTVGFETSNRVKMASRLFEHCVKECMEKLGCTDLNFVEIKIK